MRLYKFYKNRSWGRPKVCERIFEKHDDTHGRVDIEHVNDTPGTVDRMRMKNGENERLKKADGRRIFERRRQKEEKAENFKKDEKSFEKGVAFF